MYIPKRFEIADSEEIFAFIRANAFGQLISSCQGELLATHMPFLIGDDQATMLGHIARKNPQWSMLDGERVLITLQGPHDYISPTWYSASEVPTWNYQAVHIYGDCQVFHEPERLKDIVETLSSQYESSLGNTWDDEYNPSMLQAIVGLDIKITDIQCKYKMSQERPAQDQKNIADQLDNVGSHALAKAMRDHQG